MSTSLSTKGEIITEFLVRAQASTLVAFYSDAIVNSWLDQSHKWATSKIRGPLTEGRSATTFATTTNEDGYITVEYPEGWKTDSIRQLQIGGKRLQKVNFYKFQRFIEDNPSDTSRIFSDYNRQIFVNPRVDLSGTLVAWGQYTPALDLTDTAATTVFSGSQEEGNEAIVEYMLCMAAEREKKPQVAKFHLEKATLLLDGITKGNADEQFGYQSTQDDGMWKRFDVLRGGFKEDLFKRDQFF